jgi:hypothetical protein
VEGKLRFSYSAVTKARISSYPLSFLEKKGNESFALVLSLLKLRFSSISTKATLQFSRDSCSKRDRTKAKL